MKRPAPIEPPVVIQLHSVPVRNEAVLRGPSPDGQVRLSVPLNQPAWSRSLRVLFPISKEKNVELDRLGGEIFRWCDGARTVEEIIDLHKDRWQLSFFESRAMILGFLRQLLRHDFIAMVAPSVDEPPTAP